MKKYFFVLGSNSDLSLAELTAIFPDNKWEVYASVAISEFSQELDSKNLMSVLGGTIKIGEMLKTISLANRHALSDLVKKELLMEAKQEKNEGKFNFGFSFYGKQKLPGDFFKLGLAIKKDLKQIGISSRMVTSRDPILSSVVVEQNKLIEQGLEICLISEKGRVHIGKTLAVQPFKELSKRDFGRPNRDDHSGMIPPKLAQIMINLARRNDIDFKDKTILDPFCGSGTVLMEAYLMGFKNIIGSDLSDKAISDSRQNIDWIIDFKKDGKKKNINIFQSDVLQLNSKLEKNLVNYVVCEPYLGPQRGYKKFDEVVAELNVLYSQALRVLFDLLPKGARVCMIWPQFRAENKTWKMSPDIFNFKMRSTLDYALWKKEKAVRDTVVYGRAEQKVWREIIVLEK